MEKGYLMKTFKTRLYGKQRKIIMAQGREDAERGYERIRRYKNCRAEEAYLAGYDEVLTVKVAKKFLPVDFLTEILAYKELFVKWLDENVNGTYTIDNNASLSNMTVVFTFVFSNMIDATAFKLKWA